MGNADGKMIKTVVEMAKDRIQNNKNKKTAVKMIKNRCWNADRCWNERPLSKRQIKVFEMAKDQFWNNKRPR